MKFTVLVENMYLQEDPLVESWILETGGDTRGMLQKFKDWMRSIMIKVRAVIKQGFRQFTRMLMTVVARISSFFKKIFGMKTAAEHDEYTKKLTEASKSTKDFINKLADAEKSLAKDAKAGESKSVLSSIIRSYDEAHTRLMRGEDIVVIEEWSNGVQDELEDAIADGSLSF